MFSGTLLIKRMCLKREEEEEEGVVVALIRDLSQDIVKFFSIVMCEIR